METTQTNIADMQLYIESALNTQTKLGVAIGETIIFLKDYLSKHSFCENCGHCSNCETSTKLQKLIVSKSWLKSSYFSYEDFEDLNEVISSIREITFSVNFSRRKKKTFENFILPTLEKEFDSLYLAHFRCN